MIRPTCWLPSPMDSEALKLAAKTVTTRSRSSSVLARGIVVSYVLEAFFFFKEIVLEAWCSAAAHIYACASATRGWGQAGSRASACSAHCLLRSLVQETTQGLSVQLSALSGSKPYFPRNISGSWCRNDIQRVCWGVMISRLLVFYLWRKGQKGS